VLYPALSQMGQMNSKADNTVFVVDDDPGVLKALCRLLKAEGYKAAGFRSAPDFLEQYDPGAPGCVLADISMPGMTGPELQRLLEASRGSLPIIFLTGHDEIRERVHGITEHRANILRKPVTAALLFKSIEEALGRQVPEKNAK
jgi:FixJ family two-component response regulator